MCFFVNWKQIANSSSCGGLWEGAQHVCRHVCAGRKKQHPADHQNSYITTRYARFISSTPAFVVMRAVITSARNASARRSSKPESHEKETRVKFTGFRRLFTERRSRLDPSGTWGGGLFAAEMLSMPCRENKRTQEKLLLAA